MDPVEFIVVGAGSAGCVVARRLVDAGHTVALIEAGGRDTNPWIHIPVGYAKTMYDTRVNWGYHTEADPAVGGRSIYWPRGKVLGGSSSINGLVYIRGQREDFDHWRQLGNPGWSYDDVLPYFRRSEDQTRGDDAWHGTGGPLGVADLDRHPLVEAFIEAAGAEGIPRNDDFNGASQEGAGYYQLTTRNGRRSSTAVAFLKPVGRDPKLRLVVDALVERVVFDGRRAVGVALRGPGGAETIRCTREVIVAAGAINSPQLLELSGVGAAERLAGLGVPVVAELPGVGECLQDHYQIRSTYRCTRPITFNDDLRTLVGKARIGLQYLLFRKGPLTWSAGYGGCFARTRPELASPDVQFHFLLVSNDRPGGDLHPFPGFTCSVCQLRPESRGSVHAASADPAAPPTIRANYLATEGDRRTMVDGLKLQRCIMGHEPMRGFWSEEMAPGDAVATDDQLLDYVRNAGGTIFHPSGTCRMGPPEDAKAVVDPTLRVRGVEGLRVADASIMPTVVSGNTNAATIMIGEKAADLLQAAARSGGA